eukprot:791155-Pelagomonas_calceolata.AAC.1
MSSSFLAKEVLPIGILRSSNSWRTPWKVSSEVMAFRRLSTMHFATNSETLGEKEVEECLG